MKRLELLNPHHKAFDTTFPLDVVKGTAVCKGDLTGMTFSYNKSALRSEALAHAQSADAVLHLDHPHHHQQASRPSSTHFNHAAIRSDASRQHMF